MGDVLGAPACVRRFNERLPVNVFKLASPTRSYFEGLDPNMPRTKLMLSSELDEYFRTWKDDQGSFNGSLQFYRTKREDWEDERAIMGKTIGMPVFCVIPTHDPIAKQDVLDRMKAFIPRFEPASVPGGHWVLQDKNVRDELGDMIGAFFDRIRAENGQARL